MNKYVINGLVLVFWITLSDAWVNPRNGIERPIREVGEKEVVILPTKIEECTSVFNNLQRKEVNDSARRFPGAYYEDKRGNI